MAMKSKHRGTCLVCGGPAIGINFAVPTCAPCKAFFRRNAVKLGRVDFICRGDGDCKVSYECRRICNCCRLAKCFRVGMQKSLIRTPAEREARNDLVRQNRLKRAQLEQMQNSQLSRPMNITHLMQKQSKYLLTTDQAFLTNIFGAYKQAYTQPDGTEYPSFPRVEHSLLHTFFNEYEERYKFFINFIRKIPDFARLSINDKQCLLQSQYVETIVISHQIASKFLSPNLIKSLSIVYDSTSGSKANRSMERLVQYMHDPLLLKLVLIVQIFSSNFKRYRNNQPINYVYNDPLGIFATQNFYVELLWRYLLSRLPSERDTVKFFNQLVLDLLFLQDASFIIDNYLNSVPHEVNQMNPLMRSLCLV